MTFTQSIENDLLVIGEDDPRRVRVFRRSSVDETDPPADYSDGIITGVHRVVQPAPVVQAGGAVLPNDQARFHLQAAQLGYAIPDPGDVLLDLNDGRRYSIDEATSNDNDTRYVLICTAER